MGDDELDATWTEIDDEAWSKIATRTNDELRDRLKGRVAENVTTVTFTDDKLDATWTEIDCHAMR